MIMVKNIVSVVLLVSLVQVSLQQEWKSGRVVKLSGLLNDTIKDKQAYQMGYGFGDNNNNNNNQYNMQTMPPVVVDNSYGQLPGGGGLPSHSTPAPVEPWRQYVRDNEQFSCATNPDGFYPSRWCNVFYRCANYIKYEFLCAQMTNGDRSWWVQHSTSNRVTSQSDAQCIFPCILGRPCTSPGGILRDMGVVTSSQADASRIINSCDRNTNGNSQIDTSNDQFRLPNGANNCAGVPDGGFIASTFCNVFHVCTAGRRRDFLCARAANTSTYELWYNEQTRLCDWPCKVQCSKPIFGSSTTAAQIQALDTNINAALCAPTPQPGGNNNGYGNMNNNNNNPYGNMNNNNNQYGNMNNNNNNNNMYGK